MSQPFTVLVTRPLPQGERLAAAVEQRGWRSILLPTIAIEPLPEGQIDRQAILELDLFDRVIAVSPRAAELALERFFDYWPQWPAHLQWYAVGRATAKIMETYDAVAAVPNTTENSEGLLAMTELCDLVGQRVLILKGEGGRELLTEELTRRGAKVGHLSLYRRTIPHYSEAEITARLQGYRLNALTATSVETLDNLVGLLKVNRESLYEVPIAVAGERVAEAARERGFACVHTAASAADEDMLVVLGDIENATGIYS